MYCYFKVIEILRRYYQRCLNVLIDAVISSVTWLCMWCR